MTTGSMSPDVAPQDELAVADLLGDFRPLDHVAFPAVADALSWTCTLASEGFVAMPNGTQLHLVDIGEDDEEVYVDGVLPLASAGSAWLGVKGPKVARHLMAHTSKRGGKRVGAAYYESAGQTEVLVAGGPVPIQGRDGLAEIPVWVRCLVERDASGTKWEPLDWCRRSQSPDTTTECLKRVRDLDRRATVHRFVDELDVHEEGTLLVSRFEVGQRNGFPEWRVDGTRAVDLTDGQLLLRTLRKFSASAQATELVAEGFTLDEDPEDYETEAPELVE